jgi:hypothetical protein
MISIETKYLGPTNFKGARVVAFTENRSQRLTVSWNHALGPEANHDAAARALAVKLDWRGIWFRGGAASRRGNVYVCANMPSNPAHMVNRRAQYAHDLYSGCAVEF